MFDYPPCLTHRSYRESREECKNSITEEVEEYIEDKDSLHELFTGFALMAKRRNAQGDEFSFESAVTSVAIQIEKRVENEVGKELKPEVGAGVLSVKLTNFALQDVQWKKIAKKYLDIVDGNADFRRKRVKIAERKEWDRKHTEVNRRAHEQYHNGYKNGEEAGVRKEKARAKNAEKAEAKKKAAVKTSPKK